MYPNLNGWIARSGLSREVIAEAIGCNLGTLSRKLTGKAPITLKEAKTLKAVTGATDSIETLFEEARK